MTDRRCTNFDDKRRGKGKPSRKQTLGQRLMKFAGTAKGLPADTARNHDHYIDRTARR